MADIIHPIFPPALIRGDRIGIAAPAGAFSEPRFRERLNVIRTMGFEPVIPQGIFQKQGFLAGSDEHRAEILTAHFSDPDIQGVFCARGGYGSMRILPLLDYGVFQENPKVFVGFSDITALLLTITRRSGLVTFHGPVIGTLASADRMTIRSLKEGICSETPMVLAAKPAEILNPGKSTGTLVGGNLTTICHLVGTPFSPEFRRCILFLEDKGEALYRIDRMVSQMVLAGCFKGLRGLVLGDFPDCGAKDGFLSLFQRLFENFDIPIMAGFQFGHRQPNLTLPVGVKATLDTSEGTLACHTPGTRPSMGRNI